MASRGGKRQNAGRKKGQVSAPTKARIAVAEAALASGLNPLDFMLSILRDPSQNQATRFAAAKEAAPYVHPKLAAVELSGNENKPLAYTVVSGVPRHDDPVEQSELNGHSGHH